MDGERTSGGRTLARLAAASRALPVSPAKSRVGHILPALLVRLGASPIVEVTASDGVFLPDAAESH